MCVLLLLLLLLAVLWLLSIDRSIGCWFFCWFALPFFQLVYVSHLSCNTIFFFHFILLIFMYFNICTVPGCGASIMVTGRSGGSFRAVNPSLESAVTAVNNIVQALARAQPAWWKQEHEEEEQQHEQQLDEQDVLQQPTANNHEDDDDDDDDDDATIDLQRNDNNAEANKTTSSPQEELVDDDDDNDDEIFETAQS
jgi:hypothetical protein